MEFTVASIANLRIPTASLVFDNQLLQRMNPAAVASQQPFERSHKAAEMLYSYTSFQEAVSFKPPSDPICTSASKEERQHGFSSFESEGPLTQEPHLF